jgi:hypothetical protein
MGQISLSAFRHTVYLIYRRTLYLKENKMNYRVAFTINAVIVALFGVGLLFLPDFVLTQFGASEGYIIAVYLCRILGGALVLLAWFLWMLKDMANAKLQRTIATGLLAFSAAGFAFAIMGMSRQSIGVLRNNGWVLLVAYGLFALIYGYMLFLQPKEQQKSRSKKSSKSSRSSAADDEDEGAETGYRKVV